MQWNAELITAKYGPYVKGHKLQAYIVSIDDKPMAYIQLYNAYEFPRDTPLEGLPTSLAACDIFIGEPEYLSKNLGSKIMQIFLDKYGAPYFEYTFVDPDLNNLAAIRSYTKAGFERFKVNGNELWMLRKNV